MGVVYRATQVSLERPVALKVIAPELASSADFRERFKRESRLAASIEHQNVIPVYEAGEADEVLYLIMRYVEGTDLRALIDAEGALEPGRAARIVAQVAGALAAAHLRGLVHRDVKPANVLIDGHEGTDHAYLTDFGIAREVQATSGLTKTGMVVGTLDYIAPERIQDGGGDGRSDVYALGCVLYETLTGSVPFPRDSDVAKMYAHLSEPVPSPRDVRPELPDALAGLVPKAMAKDPEERFATADELAAALTREAETGGRPAPEAAALPTAPAVPPTVAAAPETVPAEPPTAPAEPPGPPTAPTAPVLPEGPSGPRRRAWALAGGGAALVAVAVGAALLLSGDDGGSNGEPPSQIVRDAVPAAELDPRALKPVRVGRGADGVAVGAGAMWVANKERDQVVRLDPTGPRVTDTLEVGGNPDSVAVGLGRVWVTNTDSDTVTIIDPAAPTVEATVPVGDQPEGIAVGRGSAFVANMGDGTVTRIDADGRPRGTESVGAEPIQLAFDSKAPWVTVTGENAVVRLDPSTGKPTERVDVAGSPRGIAFAAGLLWISATEADQIVVLDPGTAREVERIDMPENPREVRAGEGAVWVTSAVAGMVTAIDPKSREVVGSVDVDGTPYGLGVGEGRVWAASLDLGLLTPVEPGR